MASPGPLLAYEVLTAFFLEAGFLGVMLFGMNRVGPGLHFVATLMVALGTLVSATWIIASNSWMQTPQGHRIIDGRVVPVDWLAVIFNPSFPYRLAHMVIAAFLATALVVGAAAAWHLLHGRNNAPVRKMLSMAMGMVLVTAPIQAFIGDEHGLNTLEHQPAKLAAIEGHWENKPGEGVPLILFGIPDMEAEATRYAIELPQHGQPVLLTHSWDGQFPGLKDFPREDRPNSTVVFWTFRLMVGLGFLMILLGVLALWLALAAAPVPVQARSCGSRWPWGRRASWRCSRAGCTTEIGRQPWVVYGVSERPTPSRRTALEHRRPDAGHLRGGLPARLRRRHHVLAALIAGNGPETGEGTRPVEGGPGEMRQAMRPLSGSGRAPDLAAPTGSSAE